MDDVGELEQHFRQRSQENAVKFRKAMVEALKQQDWEGALEFANKVMLLDPNDGMVRSFQQLLQEKADLDNDDSEDGTETGDEDGDGDDEEGASTGVGADDSDDDDATEGDAESEDEEGDAGSREGEEERQSATSARQAASSSQCQAGPTAGGKLVSGVALDRSSCTTTTQQRAALRATLQADVKRLKEQMLISTMVAEDPLLAG